VEESSSSVHLKLGAGGIRDVELFVQTFQILYGGKDVDLRSKSTFEVLNLLIKKNIHSETFQKLKLSYLILRQAEGELHALNENGGFDWNKKDTVFDQYLLSSMEVVRQSIKEFSESTSNILGGKSQNVDHALFESKILKAIKEDRIDFALSNLRNYFSDKNKMFSYYRKAILAQEDMMNAFVDLLSYSEYGSRMLSRRPSLLDMFFLRQNIKAEDEVMLYENLSDVKMVQRILASNDFVKNKNLSNLSEKITNSYEYILNKIVKNNEGIDLLFMGKMAGREMGLKSDLDFIIVTEEDLNVSREVLNKKAREVYKKLSHPTVFGPLVPFDKDGGPMGSATPIVINLSKLEKHLKTDAPAWQKLMYIKHRFLFSESKRLQFIDKPLKEEEFLGLFEILRERLARRNGDPLKLNPGGLFHTEFIISALFLKFGFQPENSVKLNEMCKEISKKNKNTEKFDEIILNYEAIFKARELGFVANYKKEASLVKIQKDNFNLLEELSKEFLYGNTVNKKGPL
jgi:glutamate-ammonia-ligase adenylyltransferase